MITKEDIIHWFEALKNKCDKVTTGYIMILIAIIIYLLYKQIEKY